MPPTINEQFRDLVRRFGQPMMNDFQGATNLCASRKHFELLPEHLLFRMLDDAHGEVHRIFSVFKVDRGRLRGGIQQVFNQLPDGNEKKPAISEKIIAVLQQAAILSDELGFDQISPGAALLALALNPEQMRLSEFTIEMERIDASQLRDHYREILSAPVPGAAEGGGAAAGEGGAPAGGTALEQFTIDVTAKAEAGEIDPVFGRDHEIRQMIDIFARRRKNNPILVGEPGTGKTAIVEGLALRIVKGDVPPTLQGVRLISLDMGLLQAGASVKGEFENRLKNVIKEIKASEQPVITFIDEAHMLIGAGGAAGGGDAANLLKPALARGELRTCAATTWAEYKKYFEKDAALERRFQLVRCEEPSVDTTVVMLRGLKDRYEKHHKVVMLDEAVAAAAKLSDRYISGRFLPDKAVDLLDTAAARVAVGLSTRPASLDDIDRQLADIDTAIAAVERDIASGIKFDASILEELISRRADYVTRGEKIEERWKAELEAVNKVIELRSKLRSHQKAEDEAEEKGDKATAKKEVADETALRADIDKAMAALKKIQGDSPLIFPHVDGSAVAAVVSDWTGVPVGNMVSDEIAAILTMEERLRGRVVGQDHALKIIAQKLRIAKSGIGNEQQPMGVFLCVGPSGVGKTELALSVSDLLFGGERSIVTINMSEFMEAHTVSQLKGSPPGYVGYGEGGVLTEAVRQRPYSVVLLDEVEKAHPDVMNLFYQVFDKGSLADGEGRVINFKNTVVIMTSNLGTDVIQAMCEENPEVDMDTLKEGIYPHLRNHFKPALVARMTVVPFFTLSHDVLCDIARLKVAKVGRRLTAAHKMKFNVDDAVYDAIAKRCQQVDIGARQIDHQLDLSVLPQLSLSLLEQMGKETMPKSVTMGVGAEDDFTFTFED